MHSLLAVAGVATIDAFIFCKIYCMQVIPRQKKDNSCRFKISALEEFKFECKIAVL